MEFPIQRLPRSGRREGDFDPDSCRPGGPLPQTGCQLQTAARWAFDIPSSSFEARTDPVDPSVNVRHTRRRPTIPPPRASPTTSTSNKALHRRIRTIRYDDWE